MITGLESACLQALLFGTVGLHKVENHVDIDTGIVYEYKGVSFLFPDPKNSRDCIVKVPESEKISKKTLKDIIYEE